MRGGEKNSILLSHMVAFFSDDYDDNAYKWDSQFSISSFSVINHFNSKRFNWFCVFIIY